MGEHYIQLETDDPVSCLTADADRILMDLPRLDHDEFRVNAIREHPTKHRCLAPLNVNLEQADWAAFEQVSKGSAPDVHVARPPVFDEAVHPVAAWVDLKTQGGSLVRHAFFDDCDIAKFVHGKVSAQRGRIVRLGFNSGNRTVGLHKRSPKTCVDAMVRSDINKVVTRTQGRSDKGALHEVVILRGEQLNPAVRVRRIRDKASAVKGRNHVAVEFTEKPREPFQGDTQTVAPGKREQGPAGDAHGVHARSTGGAGARLEAQTLERLAG